MPFRIDTKERICEGIAAFTALIAFFPATYAGAILGAGAGIAVRDAFLPGISDGVALIMGVCVFEVLALGVLATLITIVGRTLKLLFGVPISGGRSPAPSADQAG